MNIDSCPNKESCNGVRNPEWALIERFEMGVEFWKSVKGSSVMGLEFREKCQRDFRNGVRILELDQNSGKVSKGVP